jgi:quercetin dioxygenase-like cupin family protein
MIAAERDKVIVTEQTCACHAVHTQQIHHRDFPEIHVEGLSPGDAAVHLVDRLTCVLDSAASVHHRDKVEKAIDDVRAFAEANPPQAPGGQAPAPADRVEASLAFDVRPLGPALAEARSTPLIRTERMEVIRLIIREGRQIPAHKARGEATVQCLEGLVDFTVGDTVLRLHPGQLVHLRKDEPHSLVAFEDSALLVTIALG